MLSPLVTIGAHAGFDAAGDGCCAATATRRCCCWARCCSSADAARGLHGQFSALRGGLTLTPAISHSDRCACARANVFASPYTCTVLASRNTTAALCQNPLTDHCAASPVSKPRSKISRVVRTERPAPTHTCWVSSLEQAFCQSRRTLPLSRSFVKSCGDFILAGGGVPNKVLCGGDVDAFATSLTP